jgi:hypothetical protein
VLLQAADPVAHIDQAAVVVSDDQFALLFQGRQADNFSADRNRFVALRGEIVEGKDFLFHLPYRSFHYLCQHFFDVGRDFSPSFFIRSTLSLRPMASQLSKGPSFQLNPQRIARSTLTISSAISGTREAL